MVADEPFGFISIVPLAELMEHSRKATITLYFNIAVISPLSIRFIMKRCYFESNNCSGNQTQEKYLNYVHELCMAKLPAREVSMRSILKRPSQMAKNYCSTENPVAHQLLLTPIVIYQGTLLKSIVDQGSQPFGTRDPLPKSLKPM